MQSPSGLESPPYAAATTTITTPAIASSAASASSSSAAAAKPPSYYSSAKAITPADRYAVELVLTDELRHMAATELRETDAMREQSLHAMREWIEQNPRLQRVRFDASFLLRFLRARKFSLPLAQDSLERCLLLRQSYAALLFDGINIAAPPMRQLLAAGYCFALNGRDRHGRRIVFYRPRVFDPARHPNTELLRLHGVTYEALMEDEANQVRGLCHIVDASGVGLHYLTLFTPREAVRIVKNAERTLPMRHKEIVAVGVPGRLRFAVEFGLALVTAKLRGRIRVLYGTGGAGRRRANEELVRMVGADVLPEEYGGRGGTVEAIVGGWLEELAAAQKVTRRNDELRVELGLYAARAREGAVSALRRPLGRDEGAGQGAEGVGAGGREAGDAGGGGGAGGGGCDGAVADMQGSFRKLQVD